MVAISIGGCSVVIELGKGGVDVDGTSLGMVVVGAVVVVFVTIESFVGSVCSCSDVTLLFSDIFLPSALSFTTLSYSWTETWPSHKYKYDYNSYSYRGTYDYYSYSTNR